MRLMPLCAVLGGGVVITSCVAVPAVMLNAAEGTLLSPLALAVRV